MERRAFLKLAACCAAGLSALTASANAAPLAPAPLVGGKEAPARQIAEPAVASGDQVERIKPEEVHWGGHWHGHRGWHGHHWGWRHRHWGWPHHWGWHHGWHRHWRRW